MINLPVFQPIMRYIIILTFAMIWVCWRQVFEAVKENTYKSLLDNAMQVQWLKISGGEVVIETPD